MLDSPAVQHDADTEPPRSQRLAGAGEPRPTTAKWSGLRVGFVTQLLWERYGRFWVDLVRGAGAKPVSATPEGSVAALERLAHDDFPASAFRLAAAQALALADCDLVIVPRLNPESDSQRGGAQDRWIADLPGALAAALPGVGEIVAVSAYPDTEIETQAVILLRRLLSDVGAVPRVWSRHRSAAERQARGAVRQQRQRGDAGRLAAGGQTALIGQPWTLTPEVMARLATTDAAFVSQLELDPRRCREEGRRVDERLIDTDAEVLGAVRMLSRRAGVSALRIVVDGPSPTEVAASDAWLAKRAQETSHKPLQTWHLAAALGPGAAAAGDDATHGRPFHLPEELPVD